MAHPTTQVSIMVYQSLVARFVTPVIQRHEARRDALWHAWLQRKQDAEEQGTDFNEPPPGSDQPIGNKPNP